MNFNFPPLLCPMFPALDISGKGNPTTPLRSPLPGSVRRLLKTILNYVVKKCFSNTPTKPTFLPSVDSSYLTQILG